MGTSDSVFHYHGCVQLLLNGGLHSLAAVSRVVDGEGLGEEQGCICTHLKVWNLTLQKREFSEQKKKTSTSATAELPSYTQRFPEDGLVELVEHLVHSVAAFFRVEVVQNLRGRNWSLFWTEEKKRARCRSRRSESYQPDFAEHRRRAMQQDCVLH